MRRIYSSMGMFNSYHSNCKPGKAGQDTGAIFNLEFNADGNIVVAATQRKCVLVFDAITQKKSSRSPTHTTIALIASSKRPCLNININYKQVAHEI